MGGFLNLIEAFLAFALTMLALSTAVSAIIEVGVTFFRWRRKGLRDMLSYLFRERIRNEYGDLLGRPSGHEAGASVGAERGLIARAAAKPAAAIRKVFRIPVVSDETRRLDQWWMEQRVTFIMETCMAPHTQHGAAEREDMRAEQLRRAESYRGIPMIGPRKSRLWTVARVFLNWVIRAVNWPLRLVRIWPSLKYGMSNLPVDEFRARFNRCAAGKAIQTNCEPDQWMSIHDDVVGAFRLLENAATERFTAKSRFLSIAVGFILAFAVNIDSFDLLNSYLTDPELRAAVVEQSDTYLRQAETGLPPPGLPNAVGQRQAKFDGDVDTMVRSLRDIQNSGVLTPETTAEVARVIDLANESRTTVRAIAQEYAGALARVRGIAGSLTESFPIGWTRYPKCPPGTPDARCLELAQRGGKTPAPDAIARQDFIEPPDTVFRASWGFLDLIRTIVNVVIYVLWGILWLLSLPVSVVIWFAQVLQVYYVNDPQGFFRWFFGAITTGILVGLGSPFWVGVVKELLAARNEARRLKSAAADDAPAGGP